MTSQTAPAGDTARLTEQLETANRKLAEAHRMASLGRLSAGIVHEINTPIGSILSNNEVILRSLEVVRKLLGQAQASGAEIPPKVTSILETMSTLASVDQIACERILGIVRSLKSFARVNEGELRKVDINELLRNTLKLTGCVFRKRITVETNLAESAEAECYPGLMNQVFLNLLVNAGQAIEGEGTIRVSTALEEDCVHIAISDSGHGIPPEHRARIFSAGYTTKPFGEGTGLGLTITREIVVDTHGGSIDFESAPGQGTTFHVRIPVSQRRRGGAGA